MRRPLFDKFARRAGLGLIALATAALFVATTFASPAAAHLRGQSYVYLDVGESALSGRVELPLVDIEAVFGIEFNDNGPDVEVLLQQNAEILIQFAAATLSIGTETEQWQVTFSGVELLSQDFLKAGLGFAVLPFVVEVPGGTVPRQLTVGFDAFLDEIEGRDAVLLIANDWKGGVIENEAVPLFAFDPGNRIETIDLGNTGQWQNFTASIKLGLDHIRTGSDHIFFILVLLLPAVLIFANGWNPADSFGSALWRVTKIATMFTVAHSITLSLAGLGLLPLPPARILETIIALSIAVAALHNLRPIAANREWGLAFGFGLFHGMGFASLVGSLDTSRGTQLISLAGRNLGIELAQLLVIGLVFPGLFIMRRTIAYRPFFVAGSLGLALVASVWAFERALESDTGMSKRIDSVILFPRSLGLVALFSVFALGAWWIHGFKGLDDSSDVDSGADEQDDELDLAVPVG